VVDPSAKPTDVTVPPVEAIVILDPEGVIVIPEPATRVMAPVNAFRLVTPEELPVGCGGQLNEDILI
jgi:hypothetical protein